MVSALAITYNLRVPDLFTQLMRLFDWIQFDWARFIIPAECVSHGDPAPFRMFLAAGVPFLFMALLISVSAFASWRARRLTSGATKPDDGLPSAEKAPKEGGAPTVKPLRLQVPHACAYDFPCYSYPQT